MKADALRKAMEAEYANHERLAREVAEARRTLEEAQDRFNNAKRQHSAAHESYRRAKMRYEIAVAEEAPL
jgi:chromosome segregation ATPase